MFHSYVSLPESKTNVYMITSRPGNCRKVVSQWKLKNSGDGLGGLLQLGWQVIPWPKKVIQGASHFWLRHVDAGVAVSE